MTQTAPYPSATYAQPTKRIRDPYCMPCSYCHGTGSVRDRTDSFHNEAVIYRACEACDGWGSKEGSTILVPLSEGETLTPLDHVIDLLDRARREAAGLRKGFPYHDPKTVKRLADEASALLAGIAETTSREDAA